MKSRFVFRVTASVLLVAAASVAAAGVRVALENVPAPAVKAVKDRFAKAEIRFVDKENNDQFEFAMKEGDRQFDVGVTADGKIVNVKEELSADKVPAAVKEGVLKKFPGAKIVEAEKIIKGEGKAEKTTYDLLIKTDKGSRNVEVDSMGEVIGNAD